MSDVIALTAATQPHDATGSGRLRAIICSAVRGQLVKPFQDPLKDKNRRRHVKPLRNVTKLAEPGNGNPDYVDLRRVRGALASALARRGDDLAALFRLRVSVLRYQHQNQRTARPSAHCPAVGVSFSTLRPAAPARVDWPVVGEQHDLAVRQQLDRQAWTAAGSQSPKHRLADQYHLGLVQGSVAVAAAPWPPAPLHHGCAFGGLLPR